MTTTTTCIKRPWTTSELQFLRDHYNRLGPKECARILNRPRTGVAKTAEYYGISKPLPKLTDYAERIRNLHARGTLANDMAESLHLPVSTVRHWIAQLGLPSTRTHANYTASHADRVRAGRIRFLRAQGWVGRKGDMARFLTAKRRVKALFAEPGCFTAAEVEVVKLVRENGDITAVQTSTLRNLSSRSRWTRDVLERLVDRGVLASSGKGTATTYFIPGIDGKTSPRLNGRHKAKRDTA